MENNKPFVSKQLYIQIHHRITYLMRMPFVASISAQITTGGSISSHSITRTCPFATLLPPSQRYLHSELPHTLLSQHSHNPNAVDYPKFAIPSSGGLVTYDTNATLPSKSSTQKFKTRQKASESRRRRIHSNQSSRQKELPTL